MKKKTIIHISLFIFVIVVFGFYILNNHNDKITFKIGVSNIKHNVEGENIYYKLHLDINDGSDESLIDTLDLKNGIISSELPTPTRDGYYFKGWFTDKVDGTKIDENTVLIEDTTVYAHWDIVSVLTLIANDGFTNITQTMNCINGIIPEELPTPTSRLYIFRGWFTKQGTGGTQVTQDTVFTEDTTIYAQWDLIKYTVTFDTDGHGTIDPITVYISSVIYDLPTLPNDGECDFMGWYDGDDKLTRSTNIYSDWNVKARFNCQKKYTITFHFHADGMEDITKTLYENEYISYYFNNVRQGYFLLGWFSAETGGIELDDFTHPNENNTTEYHARWIEGSRRADDDKKIYYLNFYGKTMSLGTLENDSYFRSFNWQHDHPLGNDAYRKHLVSTGDVLIRGGDLKTYTLVIVGDINGDGKINSVDFAKLWNHLDRNSDKKITDEYQLLAGDINEDTNIKATDYAQLWNILKR